MGTYKVVNEAFFLLDVSYGGSDRDIIRQLLKVALKRRVFKGFLSTSSNIEIVRNSGVELTFRRVAAVAVTCL